MSKQHTEQLITELIQNNPTGVIGLYNKYGQRRMPTVQTTVDLYHVYGEPFLMDLFNLIHQRESFLGGLFGKKEKIELPQGSDHENLHAGGGVIPEKYNKGKKWEKFKALFSKGAAALAGINTGTQTLNEKLNDAPTPPGGNDKTEDGGTILGMSKTTFYILVFSVVALIIIGLLVNKFKKK